MIFESSTKKREKIISSYVSAFFWMLGHKIQEIISKPILSTEKYCNSELLTCINLNR